MTSTATKNSKATKTKREYSQAEKNKIVDKLVTARIGLLLKHPFFGNMASRMNLIDGSEWLSTLATDGRNFYYNLEFVDKLKPKETEFGFAHEVLHNIFDHLGRFGERDKQLSNIAADYAVNQVLKDEKIGEVPSFIKIFQDNKYRGWSFEQIYEELYQKCDKIDLSKLGQLLDEHLDGDKDGDGEGGDGRPVLTAEERKQIRDEIKEAMIAAAQSAGAGRVPASVRRLIGDITEPKMDWKQMLQMNIQSIVKNNYSFSRFNRKSQHSGAILPGLLNENTIDVSVAIDMSGSISNQQAKDMLSEVAGIMGQFSDFKIRLWCFDTKVYSYAEFTQDNAYDLDDYEVKGGGGTLFEANYEFMKDNEIEPKLFIMFTDGYPCGSWGDADYCETLFIIHGTDKVVAPFGQTAYYK